MIVDTYYEAFLANHYRATPASPTPAYEQQHRALLDRSFGTADAYSRNLRELGHEATELISNCRPMQLKWAEERSLPLPAAAKLRPAPLAWGTLRRILDAQIEELDPDVVYVQDVPHVERLAAEGAGRPRPVSWWRRSDRSSRASSSSAAMTWSPRSCRRS